MAELNVSKNQLENCSAKCKTKNQNTDVLFPTCYMSKSIFKTTLLLKFYRTTMIQNSKINSLISILSPQVSSFQCLMGYC